MDGKRTANFKPYEGDKPYIFVSYSHKDNERVIPLLEAMHRAGYRVWYDDGIHLGDDWVQTLEGRIDQCGFFLPLVSPASLESDFCFAEIRRAKREGKPVAPVYLEEVVMPLDWEAYLSRRQHDRILEGESEDAFLHRLSGEAVFVLCRRDNAAHTETVADSPEDDTQPSETVPLPSVDPVDWRGDGYYIKWFVDENGCLLIAREDSSNGEMPDYPENGQPWKTMREKITSAIIENGITNIGSYAFSECANLNSVSLPSSIVKIGEEAFSGCICLSDISIPHGVKSIGESAFAVCTNLRKMEIPTSVTDISRFSFFHCSTLVKVIVPNGISNIRNGAFMECRCLTDIILPSTLTSIDDYSFKNCSSLRRIRIPNNVTDIGVEAFRGCNSLYWCRIPDSVSSIDDGAFTGCTSLTSIAIPASAKIADNTFDKSTTVIRRPAS